MNTVTMESSDEDEVILYNKDKAQNIRKGGRVSNNQVIERVRN